MAALDPIFPIVGGLMIGTSAGLYLLLDGRISGISGLAASVTGLAPAGSPRSRAAGFIGGLLSGAAGALALVQRSDFAVTSSIALLVVGGLLVGFGTRLGSGCTSGHGVCGLARLSRRSIAATGTFMLTAATVVFLVRHLAALT
jgi:uncharacterized membrane protein YedE/YeeE